jgi:hypothetical protein
MLCPSMLKRRRIMMNCRFMMSNVFILNGKILEHQKDKNTAEWKYKIYGPTISNNEAEIIVKMGPTGKLVVITVYKP